MKAKLTPLMKQYTQMKTKHPDAILLFRMGDFYETFNEDAVKTSKILGITLTKRNKKDENSETLAGFPHHALDTYLHKIVKAGYRVAICEQLEDPKKAKGIVKRGVQEIVTPGITFNDKILNPTSNNYLLSIFIEKDIAGIAYLDIATGEFEVFEGSLFSADRWIMNLKPSEILLPKHANHEQYDKYEKTFFFYKIDEWVFDYEYAEDLIKKQFELHSLKGFGIEKLHLAVKACGALLFYLKENQQNNLEHLRNIRRVDEQDYIWMDNFTIKNLELFQTNFQNGIHFYDTINKTTTSMGARLLKKWILTPLLNLEHINKRLSVIDYFFSKPDLANSIETKLKTCADLYRIVSKIPSIKINPREAINLSKTLRVIDAIKTNIEDSNCSYLQESFARVNPILDIANSIDKTIVDNPPVYYNKGNLIKDGVSDELDELRKISSSGKHYLIELQKKECLATNIPTLKIAYNNVFGYYLEVTNIHKDKVPENWIRKQTLTNAERYITPELKEYENKILNAEEQILTIEADIYIHLIKSLLEHIHTIQTNAVCLSELDVLLSFYLLSSQNHYHKPELHEGNTLSLTKARHPVIEQNMQEGEQYISNNLELGKEMNQQIIILTGPNMSGKSAILRQTALIILMGHMGCYVSAEQAKIPLTDKIFTRVGASDNLYSGESTFMVEMNETSSIINNLSEKSILFLDEIGRGTSTYDGVSISWALTEYLHSISIHKAKTIFATHYHELNELEKSLNDVKNFHISHIEKDGKVIFLRKLKRGGSNKSFGIHVAQMAGFPKEIIYRANEILQKLEKDRKQINTLQHNTNNISTISQQVKRNQEQEAYTFISNMLNGIDINRITPIEALMKLKEIIEKSKIS